MLSGTTTTEAQNHRQAAATEASIPIVTSRPESSPSMMRSSIGLSGGADEFLKLDRILKVDRTSSKAVELPDTASFGGCLVRSKDTGDAHEPID
jgi:hypothetical protein